MTSLLLQGLVSYCYCWRQAWDFHIWMEEGTFRWWSLSCWMCASKESNQSRHRLHNSLWVSISSRLSLVGRKTLLMREPPWESHQIVIPPWKFAGNTPLYQLVCPRAPELLFRLATVCGYFQSGKLKIPREPLPLFSPLIGQRARK